MTVINIDDYKFDVYGYADELNAEINKLKETISDLKKQLGASQSKWVSCAERLPDEHRRYLCMAYIVDCYVEEVCLYDKENKRFLFNRVEVKVSHYQSLPDKPVEK